MSSAPARPLIQTCGASAAVATHNAATSMYHAGKVRAWTSQRLRFGIRWTGMIFFVGLCNSSCANDHCSGSMIGADLAVIYMITTNVRAAPYSFGCIVREVLQHHLRTMLYSEAPPFQSIVLHVIIDLCTSCMYMFGHHSSLSSATFISFSIDRIC